MLVFLILILIGIGFFSSSVLAETIPLRFQTDIDINDSYNNSGGNNYVLNKFQFLGTGFELSNETLSIEIGMPPYQNSTGRTQLYIANSVTEFETGFYGATSLTKLKDASNVVDLGEGLSSVDFENITASAGDLLVVGYAHGGAGSVGTRAYRGSMTTPSGFSSGAIKNAYWAQSGLTSNFTKMNFDYFYFLTGDMPTVDDFVITFPAEASYEGRFNFVDVEFSNSSSTSALFSGAYWYAVFNDSTQKQVIPNRRWSGQTFQFGNYGTRILDDDMLQFDPGSTYTVEAGIGWLIGDDINDFNDYALLDFDSKTFIVGEDLILPGFGTSTFPFISASSTEIQAISSGFFATRLPFSLFAQIGSVYKSLFNVTPGEVSDNLELSIGVFAPGTDLATTTVSIVDFNDPLAELPESFTTLFDYLKTLIKVAMSISFGFYMWNRTLAASEKIMPKT